MRMIIPTRSHCPKYTSRYLRYSPIKCKSITSSVYGGHFGKFAKCKHCTTFSRYLLTASEELPVDASLPPFEASTEKASIENSSPSHMTGVSCGFVQKSSYYEQILARLKTALILGCWSLPHAETCLYEPQLSYQILLAAVP